MSLTDFADRGNRQPVILCVKQFSLSYGVFEHCLRRLKAPRDAERITRTQDLWALSPDTFVLYIFGHRLYSTWEDHELVTQMYYRFNHVTEVETDSLLFNTRL